MAAERLLSPMDHLVPYQVCLLSECFDTVLALERPQSIVYSLVIFQMRRFLELFVAVLALVATLGHFRHSRINDPGPVGV